jgi:hypothetical protein
MDIYTRVANALQRLEDNAPAPTGTGVSPEYYWNQDRFVSDEEFRAMGPAACTGTKWYNDGTFNKRYTEHPGEGWSVGRKKYSRVSPTQETRDKMSKTNKGQVAHNKGKVGVSDETSKKMSVAAKKRATSESMKRVRSYRQGIM